MVAQTKGRASGQSNFLLNRSFSSSHFQSWTSHTPPPSKSWLSKGFHAHWNPLHDHVLGFSIFLSHLLILCLLSVFQKLSTLLVHSLFTVCLSFFFYSLVSFGGVSGWNVSAYIQPAIINWIVSRISLFSYSFSCRHLNKRSLCLCVCALFYHKI